MLSIILPFYLLSLASALPSQLVPCDNTTVSVYTTHGSISVYTESGSRVGCLDLDGRATSNSDACATFTSIETTAFTAWYDHTVNYTLATTKGFCGVTLHNGDAYAAGLNQDYGHVWECKADMPLYQPPNSGYASVEYSSGVNALIGKETIGSGYAEFNAYWNTVGGVALNDTPAVMQAELPDYQLGTLFAFVPEFQPSPPQ